MNDETSAGEATARTEVELELTADQSQDGTAPLTARQLQLVAALVLNPEIEASAVATGVGHTTAHRWLKLPAFREELARQRNTVFIDEMSTVKTHATRALKALTELISTSDERLRRIVCTDILDRAMKIRELEDLEKRLTALEEAAEEDKKRNRFR